MLVMESNTLPRYAPAPYSLSGLGALASPAVAAANVLRGCGASGCGWTQAMGADDVVAPGAPAPSSAAVAAASETVGVVVVLGLLAVAGLLSYQAGKAMTPPGSSKKTWGWVGVPVGLITGAPGLGVMGWISNAKR